jgi:predicted Zn-dependent protease with MMP-like domain
VSVATAGKAHAVREQRRTGLTGEDGSRPPRTGKATRRIRAVGGRPSPRLARVDDRVAQTSGARRRRDRHGRGMRGPLVPATVTLSGRTVHVPAARTRGERFDDLVLDAVEDLEQRWARELEGVEFAVEDVPAVAWPAETPLDDDVLADETAGGAVPLGRLLPAGTDDTGRPTTPRVVVYRRPLEARAADAADLADLVHDVVVDQVARLLRLDPDEIDPPPSGG